MYLRTKFHQVLSRYPPARRSLSGHEICLPRLPPLPTSRVSSSLILVPDWRRPSACAVRCLSLLGPAPHTRIEGWRRARVSWRRPERHLCLCTLLRVGFKTWMSSSHGHWVHILHQKMKYRSFPCVRRFSVKCVSILSVSTTLLNM